MADINLLQSSVNQKTERKFQGLLNTIGIVILVIIVASYGLLFFLTSSAQKGTSSRLAEETQIKQDIQSQGAYADFVSHQNKLKNIDLLLKNHLTWCKILPTFAENTLKNAKYTKFDANQDGSTTITGTVPDFQNLAKMIQAFQLDQKQFIKDVKLVSVGLSTGEKNDVTYTINVTFNKQALQKTDVSCN